MINRIDTIKQGQNKQDSTVNFLQHKSERTGSSVEPELSIYIGARMREQRIFAGFSQTKLGEKLGVSFQQIQKYERGANSLSVGRLFDLAQIFGVDIEYFIKGFVHKINPVKVLSDKHKVRNNESNLNDVNIKVLELARYFQKIQNASVRQALFQLVRDAASE
jgi:transcriptional regulator with XRE-family HTH domain